MALGITALDHVSVVIRDDPETLRFYRDVLGLREVAPPRTFDFPVVWFDLGGTMIHLIPRGAAEGSSPRHFALAVADIAAARARLEDQGVATHSPTPIPGADRFFVHDPSGNLIEFIQWYRRYDPATDGRPATGERPAAPPPSAAFEPGRMGLDRTREPAGAEAGAEPDPNPPSRSG